MLHARLFSQLPTYRAEQFTTAPGDRPLLAQFCGNDPATVLAAARHVVHAVDGVDLNLGCPQRIARRGRYGAFLMDDPDTVAAIVATLAHHLPVPVTAKMRIFDDPARTVAFARMLEASGASLVAVHGRTRAAKDPTHVRADWAAIAAVKAALRVPVLANGDVRSLDDVDACLAATGADGVLSAVPLLEDPALFSPARDAGDPTACARRALEYADLAEEHPTPPRMVRAHAFRMLGAWLSEFTDLRDALNAPGLTPGKLRTVATDALARIQAAAATGRTAPIPKLSERALARAAREAAVAAAVEEAAREEAALRAADAVAC
jgi:tRNA-dihydrouridine synthase 1